MEKFKGYNKNYYKEIENELKSSYENFLSKKNLADIVDMKYKTIGNSYSFRNTIMAMIQAEKYGIEFTGTMKGLKQWSDNKVKVYPDQIKNKLHILRPIFKKITENGKEESKLIYFTVCKVYDISQTDSEDYIKHKNDLKNIVYNHTINDLLPYETCKQVVLKYFKHDLIENFKEVTDGHGSYNPLNNTIKIITPCTHTLLHEFSHYIQKDTLKDCKFDYLYALNEVIAEISTYLLCKKFSKEIDYNYNYSQVWSKNFNLKYTEFEKLFKTIQDKIKHIEF